MRHTQCPGTESKFHRERYNIESDHSHSHSSMEMNWNAHAQREQYLCEWINYSNARGVPKPLAPYIHHKRRIKKTFSMNFQYITCDTIIIGTIFQYFYRFPGIYIFVCLDAKHVAKFIKIYIPPIQHNWYILYTIESFELAVNRHLVLYWNLNDFKCLQLDCISAHSPPKSNVCAVVYVTYTWFELRTNEMLKLLKVILRSAYA